MGQGERGKEQSQGAREMPAKVAVRVCLGAWGTRMVSTPQGVKSRPILEAEGLKNREGGHLASNSVRESLWLRLVAIMLVGHLELVP